MSGWKGDAMALSHQATAVIECLSNEPDLTAGPLVLIGHSLGGLVIKKALQHGMGKSVGRHRDVAQNTKGVAFVGTPHFGSLLATIASRLRLLRANQQVRDMRQHDANLTDLNQHFLAICSQLDLKTRVFVETQPLRVPWIGRFLPGATIVSPTSSEAHTPGEVGIPIAADHITIAKPRDRSAEVYRSIVALVRDVERATQAPPPQPAPNPLPSESVDAMHPDAKPDDLVHLAFAIFGIELDGVTDSPICASACITTDRPEQLRRFPEEVRQAVRDDPLVDPIAKRAARDASLSDLIANPGTRAVVLRALAVTSFSAYLYYCRNAEFNRLTRDERIQKFFVEPLTHRLSKKGERLEQVHTRLEEMSEYLQQAAASVQGKYHRNPAIPTSGGDKHSAIEELASLIAAVSCHHLGNPSEGNASEAFASLRTRIRYAENVATGEKHKRDENPLP